jgi:hypothetical protein
VVVSPPTGPRISGPRAQVKHRAAAVCQSGTQPIAFARWFGRRSSASSLTVLTTTLALGSTRPMRGGECCFRSTLSEVMTLPSFPQRGQAPTGFWDVHRSGSGTVVADVEHPECFSIRSSATRPPWVVSSYHAPTATPKQIDRPLGRRAFRYLLAMP